MVKLHLRQHENLPYVGLSITYFFGSFDVFITFRIYPFNKKNRYLILNFYLDSQLYIQTYHSKRLYNGFYFTASYLNQFYFVFNQCTSSYIYYLSY